MIAPSLLFWRVMDLTKIKSVLDVYASDKGYTLFDVTYHRNDSTLSVMFDEEFSMEELEKVSGEVSSLLDGYEDEFEDNYFLDVSTVGAERPIRNLRELKEAVGSYVFIRDDEHEYYGDLKEMNEDAVALEVRDKNRTKVVEIPCKKIKEMRYAVKF